MSPTVKNSTSGRPLRVSIVALPESTVSTLISIYEVFDLMSDLCSQDPAFPKEKIFQPEIVAATESFSALSETLPLRPHRGIAEVDRTDIVVIPSMMVQEVGWKRDRYPDLVRWLTQMHATGAELCSACSGILVLAETGLWNGGEATIHWLFAPTFERNFPEVTLRLREVLVVSGRRGELVTSGASTSWHDLVLFLVARHVGPAAAQSLARIMLMQWHQDGQGPYVVFSPPTDHGDAVIRELQDWLEDNFAATRAVEELVKLSQLPERTFKRRFSRATGLAPIAYVQRLRVEEAKRRLERTDIPIDEVSWAVGYEEPAFFRRLFKRLTGITPGEYRRKFRVPDFARPRRE